MEARDYQIKATAKALKSHSALVVSPGGSGKTIMIALMVKTALRARRRVAIVTHSRELVDQVYDHLLAMRINPDKIGLLINGAEPKYDRMIQLGTIQTFTARKKKNHYLSILIIDEAHRAPASSYVELMRKQSPERVYGFTATPYRLDGRSLGNVFDDMVIAAMPMDMIKRGFIAKPRIFTTLKEQLPDLSFLRAIRGDYSPTKLGAQVDRTWLNGNVVENYLRHAKGRKAIAFCVSVKHAEHLAKAFCERGIKSKFVEGNMPDGQRKRVIDSFRGGDTTVLTNCNLLSEGFDVPQCQAVILARPTLSFVLYMQQSARAMRVHSSQRPIILDHGDNVMRFGFPYVDRDYTFSDHDWDIQDKCGAKTCPKCFAVVASWHVACEECGYIFESDPVVPEESNDVLSIQEMRQREVKALQTRIEKYFERTGERDEQWMKTVLEAYGAKRA